MSTVQLVWKVARNSVVLWGGLLFVPIGGVFTAIGIKTGLDEYAFVRDAHPVQATIVGRSLRKADLENNPSTRYLVHYRFDTPTGTRADGSKEVSVEQWEQLEPGSTITVEFVPQSPARSRSVEDSDWPAAAAFSGLGAIFLVVGTALLVTALRELLRYRRLSRSGVAASATVTTVTHSATVINGVQQWEIHYSYADQAGKPHEGRSACVPPEEAQRWRRGDRGLVRFDSQAPASSIWVGRDAP
jgi:hypothetical protein